MEGLFYSFSVPFEDIINKYTVTSSALSEEQIMPCLNAAENIFLLPVVGKELLEHLNAIAQDAESDDVENMALEEARCAVANLALWYSFDELNTHLTDQGWKREEGDTYKSLYHYQEIDLKTTYRNKGYNAVDRLIALLSASKHVFAEVTEAPFYIEKEKALVKGAEEIDKFFSIHQSSLVYLSLKPNLKIVQENELQSVIGTRCYDLLIAYLEDENKADRTDRTVMEKLRSNAAAYVICIALARQMEMAGSLTDRGMYYESVNSSDRNNVKIDVLPIDERKRIAYMLRGDALHYLGRLLSYIERNLPTYFVGRPGDAFQRENENKHTFWA